MHVDTCGKVLEARARRAAKRVGLVARKSRRMRSCDNYGSFMLINLYTNGIVAGVRFELTAEDVITYCNE